MIRILTLTLFFSYLLHSALAQQAEQAVNTYGAWLPTEKIHVHFDKESYLPGETIWFKAYVFEEYLPTSRSTNFYIALYDQEGKMVQEKVCPIISATTDGFFTIPDTLHATQLVCRAYTSWMLNDDRDFLFTRSIRVFNNVNKTDTARKTVSLQFFPEGGDLIEGENNSIAFMAHFNNGLPFELKGLIRKRETGELVDSFKTIHDGMGRFNLFQQPGEHYYAEWKDQSGNLQQTSLPAYKTSGVLLQVVRQKNKLIYNVVNHTASGNLHLLGTLYHKTIFTADLPLPAGERTNGRIPLDSLPSGLMQLTVFDHDWHPLAERVFFISNQHQVKAQINLATINLQKRGKNAIEISLPDTIPANMSLSVTDADFNREASTTNILTDLLLGGDLRGYIHDPAYYFSKESDPDLAAQLDLVMLTHGWRRYNWDKVFAGSLPVINFPVDNYLGVYGQMSADVLQRIKKDEQVNLIFKTKDSSSNVYTVSPDTKGLLNLGGLIFFDTAKVYFSFNTQRQYNKQMAFSTGNLALEQPAQIFNFSDRLVKDTAGTGFNAAAIQYQYYFSQQKNESLKKEKTLENVTVKSGGWHNWKNDPLTRMDEKYSGGIFKGGATAFSFDVLHDESAWTKLDIYSYLANKVPGLVISYPKSAGRGGSSLGAARTLTYTPKEAPLTVFLDEREIEFTELEMTQLSQIAYVKLIPNFFRSGLDAGGSVLVPALAIYTKKGDDMRIGPPSLTDLGMVKVAGYSPQKEFYEPDYTTTPDALGNDARTTLLWRPYILSGKNNTTLPISFFNNDFSQRLRIVLEGINDEGKLIHVEKIIE